jgi:hypothetical protein
MAACSAVLRHAPPGHARIGVHTVFCCGTGAGVPVAFGDAEQAGAGPKVTFESRYPFPFVMPTDAPEPPHDVETLIVSDAAGVPEHPAAA